MNIIQFKDYTKKSKTPLNPYKSSNDNDPTWTVDRLNYFSDTGERLTPGESGQMLVIETQRRRSCPEF
ncbi:MAG: hypothetical protein IOC49_12015 [Methylobacterium sp.]|nr:hypothetical protein [Methylobacterium sp.]